MRVCSNLPAARFNTGGPCRNREADSPPEKLVGVLRKQAVPIDIEAEMRNREAQCDDTAPFEKRAVR
jgi:hypothetical protein